ncbi:hypothetical protein Taro_032305 [Colocasia esculenta]|uniref:Uncharacterized protein n=1 Tax=Colocasia esculenta TaxID=4460 RepID=A0A843W3J3_COLES|nr:hypothetical protein [Colocasia esculenta]
MSRSGSDKVTVAFMPSFRWFMGGLSPTLVVRPVLGTCGLVRGEVVTVIWTPGPRASIEGDLQVAGELELQTLVAEGEMVRLHSNTLCGGLRRRGRSRRRLP